MLNMASRMPWASSSSDCVRNMVYPVLSAIRGYPRRDMASALKRRHFQANTQADRRAPGFEPRYLGSRLLTELWFQIPFRVVADGFVICSAHGYAGNVN